MRSSDLPQVERDAIALLLEGESPRQRALRVQWTQVESVVRRPDPVGVYVNIKLSDDAKPLPGAPDFELSDVWADSPGAETIGFILFIREGRISTLEGYVHGDCYPHDAGRSFVLRREVSAKS